ncbi:MAG: hypothetical protein BWY14_01004 [Parcubacteria group bacterium ADurb.Bin192]|nr:MAG: hypothetical protein BWY14_01004 [Parcubacteria group bacterium ADurb.Bin192]
MGKTISNGVYTSSQDILNALEQLQTNACDMLLNTGGLAIGSSSKAAVKIANTVYAMIDGALVKKTTAEVALSGTVTNAKFNVYVLSMDASGTVTASMGTEGATIGAVVFPTVPDDEVVLGFVIVNPTGTGNFVGGTTALDDATVAPNAVYVNTPYPFNLNALSL